MKPKKLIKEMDKLEEQYKEVLGEWAVCYRLMQRKL